MKTSSPSVSHRSEPATKKLLTVDYEENRICKHTRYLRKPLVWTVAFILAALLPCGAQPFRIESLQFDAQFRPRLGVPADTNSYYRLLAGQEIGSLRSVLTLSLSNTVVAPQPATNRQGYYRVQQVPLASPVDSDGDGIDDLWEFQHSLDPLLASDAAQIVPGDTRNWLETYVAEKAFTFAYQYAPDQATDGGGLAQDPVSKAVYASGQARGADGIWHSLVLKSTNGGISWSTNAPILDDPSDQAFAVTPILCVDSSGNVYALRYRRVKAGSSAEELTVLKSDDGGGSWSLVNVYPGEPSWGSGPTVGPGAAAADRNGNVYVVGGGIGDPNATFYWFVRKFTAASNAWTTVDVYRVSGWAGGPAAVVCDPSGAVFVAGMETSGTACNCWRWVVRRSRDGGANWQTVSTYQPYENSSGSPGIAADAKGNIYVTGYVFDPDDTPHWIVRTTSDSGVTWRTIDNISGGYADGIAVDGGGRLNVIGKFGGPSWVLRQSWDGGETWIKADDFAYGDGSYATVPRTILGLFDGNILVSGAAWALGDPYLSSSCHWLLRRLPRPPTK